jgi:hypothetical protein
MRSLVFALTFSASSLAGQSTALRGSGPADVARSFFAALADQRFLEAAQLADLTALERRRQQALRFMRRPPQAPPRMTVEDWMKRDPDMPRVVAEYQIAQMEKSMQAAERNGPWDYDFARINDSTEFKNLSITELGARWLEARDERYQMQSMSASFMPPGCTLEQLVAALPKPLRSVLGVVEVADTAWVLYRNSGADGRGDIMGPSVLLMRRSEGVWRIRTNDFMFRGASGGSGSLAAVSCQPIDTTRRRPPS